MIIEKPIRLRVEVRIEPMDGYSNHIYDFTRTKTITDNSLESIVKTLNLCVKQIAKETSELSCLKMVLNKCRENAMHVEQELKQIESKTEVEQEEII